MLDRSTSAIRAAEAFSDVTAACLMDGTFVRLVLSAPTTTADGTALKILGRSVMLRGTPHLSLTFRHPTKDVTKNIPAAESAAWLREQLGVHYRSALLCTTKADQQFISKEDGASRLIKHKATTKKAPARTHDQPKATLLGASARDWLHGLGVLDRNGKLRPTMADKHRQISHYLEILSHLAKECGWPTPGIELAVADMGCGKGYLTFGAWHLFRRIWRQPVRVIGVETRADLVATTSKLALQIHAHGLEFIPGTIETVKLPPLNALIALHACDTATDHAIRRGIESDAELIVTAPCCQKELRPQLGKPEPFTALLRHGVMEERLAEWITDGLRALFLEWAGYRTKVMEFVSTEHTPKNLMIAAIREREAFIDDAIRQRIKELKRFFGVERHALDDLLVRP